MDSTPMTFTSLALIVLLVIMLVMFACHLLGPRASSWLRSNNSKEEKIGLSKNKLFHANGYMIHSGSEFLLSNSGSFKRFDTIDKEDFKEAGQQPGTQHATTPLWNLPQVESNIPPQPLRPAPAIGTPSAKTVTFSFAKLNEASGELPPSPELNHGHAHHLGNGQTNATDGVALSCLRSAAASAKPAPIPQLIGAPPPQRLSSSSSVTLSSTAIPRPVAKRQISLQNGIGMNCTAQGPAASSPNGRSHGRALTRRNSSTNPFLCESAESLPESVCEPQPETAPNPNLRHSNHQLRHLPTPNGQAPASEGTHHAHSPGSSSNPFYEDPEATGSSNYSLNMAVMAGQRAEAAQRTARNTAQGGSNGTPEEQPPICNGSHKQSPTPVHTRPGPGKQHVLESQQFRNRSFSETEAIAGESDLKAYSSKMAAAGLQRLANTTNPFTGLTQKIKGPHMLQKTISEDFLFRKLAGNQSNSGGGGGSGGGVTVNGGNTTWSFGRSLMRQDSTFSLGRRNSSQSSLNSSVGSMDGIHLERAISCESVESDSSVFLSDLDQPYTQITGYLCVGLHYDKNSITDDGMELTVSLLEAKSLICPFSVDSLDTFVRIYLVPDQAGAMQTKVFKNSPTPSYNESFNFWLKKQQGRHSLWFHLYHNGLAHTLIGEAEMEIGEMPRPITTWIPLSDSRKCNAKWGELMFSLSYLPTAERLTIVVVKGRNLKLDVDAADPAAANGQIQSVFVKVYLMNNDRKVLKKRTALKRTDRFPIFNESMIFSVPPHSLTTVKLRLTVFGAFDDNSSMRLVPLGHVIAGSCATGKGLRHWHQMLSSLRKPVAMWHVLRRATNQPVFTGGAEAVVAAMQSTALRAKRNSII